MSSLFTVFDKARRKRVIARAKERSKYKKSYECLGMRKLNGNMMGENTKKCTLGVMLKRRKQTWDNFVCLMFSGVHICAASTTREISFLASSNIPLPHLLFFANPYPKRNAWRRFFFFGAGLAEKKLSPLTASQCHDHNSQRNESFTRNLLNKHSRKSGGAKENFKLTVSIHVYTTTHDHDEENSAREKKRKPKNLFRSQVNERELIQEITSIFVRNDYAFFLFSAEEIHLRW